MQRFYLFRNAVLKFCTYDNFLLKPKICSSVSNFIIDVLRKFYFNLGGIGLIAGSCPFILFRRNFSVSMSFIILLFVQRICAESLNLLIENFTFLRNLNNICNNTCNEKIFIKSLFLNSADWSWKSCAKNRVDYKT